MRKVVYLLVLTGFFQLISCSSTDKTAQEKGAIGMKQKHFSNEQIQADALAMADISCQWEVAKYNAALQENNRKLKQKEKSLYELKFAFEQKMKVRYMQIEDLEKKFSKALEKAHIQLSACEKLDVIREMEKEREKAKEESQ